jgi:hypothetical protein
MPTIQRPLFIPSTEILLHFNEFNMNNPAQQINNVLNVNDELIAAFVVAIYAHLDRWTFAKNVARGGWEGWAQIELLSAFQEIIAVVWNPNHVVQREVVIWGQNAQNAVDFCFTFAPGNDPNGNANRFWGVELKCRTQLADHASFIMDYQGDCTKVEQAPANQWTPMAGYAIAITDDWTDTQHFNNIDVRNYVAIAPAGVPAPINGQQGQAGVIYLIWAKFFHP